jgi:hypothetical protein
MIEGGGRISGHVYGKQVASAGSRGAVRDRRAVYHGCVYWSLGVRSLGSPKSGERSIPDGKIPIDSAARKPFYQASIP